MTSLSFAEPRNLQEAIALLQGTPKSRCLAGGGSLVPLMNEGMFPELELLVNLRRIEELRIFSALPDGGTRIGAMVTHRQIANAPLLDGGHNVLRQAASRIANLVVRNMGTIGGSLAFSDPAADYPAALLATDARIEILGQDGLRTVPAAAFFRGRRLTALQPGEIVTAVELPASVPGARSAYQKFSKTGGDFAIASLALVLHMQGGTVAAARICIGGCAPFPVSAAAAEAALHGGTLTEAQIDVAVSLIGDVLDPEDDVRATGKFRRLVAPRLLRKALRKVLAQKEAV